jgi:hypothetical protein
MLIVEPLVRFSATQRQNSFLRRVSGDVNRSLRNAETKLLLFIYKKAAANFVGADGVFMRIGKIMLCENYY